MDIHEIAWSPELSHEIVQLQHPDKQQEVRARAAQLRQDQTQWLGFTLRCNAVLDHARRGLTDPVSIFSATPMGIEEYLISYLVLRPHLDPEQQEWLAPRIRELLSIAQETRQIRIALRAAHPPTTPH